MFVDLLCIAVVVSIHSIFVVHGMLNVVIDVLMSPTLVMTMLLMSFVAAVVVVAAVAAVCSLIVVDCEVFDFPLEVS